MTAGAFVVSVGGDSEGRQLSNGVDTAVVYAGSSADAAAYAEAMYAKYMPAVWAAATPLLVAGAADLAGWKFRVRVIDNVYGSAYSASAQYSYGDFAVSGGKTYQNIRAKGSLGVDPSDPDVWVLAPAKVNVDVTVVGAANDTFDTVAAKMVTALNATTLIDGAAYNATTQVLTVAATTDGLGDNQVVATWVAPGANEDVTIPGFVASKVDQGVSGDALSVTLAADGYTVPAVIGKFRRA